MFPLFTLKVVLFPLETLCNISYSCVVFMCRHCLQILFLLHNWLT